MGRLLILTACLLALTLFPKGPLMAEQNATYRYNASISTRGVVWSLRTNDLFQTQNINPYHADKSPQIGVNLRPGRNTLSLEFSPLNGQDPETGAYTYALRDGLEIFITITRNGWKDRTWEEIHPVFIRYDAEAGSWVNVAQTRAGLDRQLNSPHMRSSGMYEITELPEDRPLTFRNGPQVESSGGYRLDFTFETDDYFPPFPWENDAVTLEDTPALRKELRAAYQRVYNTIARNDNEAIFREVAPIWANTAYLLTTKASAREFADNSRTFPNLKADTEDGSILQPLRIADSPEQDMLQFMGQNRLVRIWVNPIIWENPPAGSNSQWAFPVVFYKTRSGEWKIGDINSGF